MNKKINPEAKEENKEESKESIIIPSIPKIKKTIIRNHKNFKKIPSTNYIHNSTLNKMKLIRTINYSIKEDNDKKDMTSIRSLQENERNKDKKINSLKHIKSQFYTNNTIYPNNNLYSGKRIFSNKKNKNNIKSHKTTFSEIPSINSILNNHNSNNNTTATTHKNSNGKNNTNSFQKCRNINNLHKINLKTLSRKNSFKNSNYIKKNICPIRQIINRNNSINDMKEKNMKGKNKNKSYTFMSKTQSYYYDNDISKEDNAIKRNNNIKYSEEYLDDILYNLLIEEKNLEKKINSLYFANQPEINEKKRAILIDWLIDVNNKFCFKPETLYITINIIDTYLSLKKIQRSNLQLLGVTALFIACKQNEIIFRRLKEYAYITDNAYDINDILKMENDILKTLDFNILFPSALTFYEILGNKFEIFEKNEVLTGTPERGCKGVEFGEKFNLGHFLIQSFYISEKSLKYYASTIACSAIYIVMKFYKMKNYQVCYDNNLYNIKGEENKMNIIKECAKDICFCIGDIAKNNLKAAIRNFSSEKYGNISKLVFGNLILN